MSEVRWWQQIGVVARAEADDPKPARYPSRFGVKHLKAEQMTSVRQGVPRKSR